MLGTLIGNHLAYSHTAVQVKESSEQFYTTPLEYISTFELLRWNKHNSEIGEPNKKILKSNEITKVVTKFQKKKCMFCVILSYLYCATAYFYYLLNAP